MKKLLLIVLGVSTLVSIVLIFAFRAWVGRVSGTMPAEGKAIFARIDPAKCSAQDCVACPPDDCEARGCKVFEYTWTHEGQAYTRHYCGSAEAMAPAESSPVR